MRCSDCNEDIGFFQGVMSGFRCESCAEKWEKEKEEFLRKEREKSDKQRQEEELREKAKEEFFEYLQDHETNLFQDGGIRFVGKPAEEVYQENVSLSDNKSEFCVWEDSIIDMVIKNKFDIAKTIKEIEEELETEIEVDKIKKREKRFNARERAEKKVYGKVKTKRKVLSKDEQDAILKKFGSKCAICNAEEGLHIHHKDENPQNNQTDNLIVLCGVCHKKVHMKVR